MLQKPNICAANILATCAQNYRLSKINEEASNLPTCLQKGPPEGRSNCARPSSLHRDHSHVSEPAQNKQHSSVLELRTSLTIPDQGRVIIIACFTWCSPMHFYSFIT